MNEVWQVLERKPVIEHPFLQVTMETVSLPDGRVITDWPIVNCRDYVNVLVINEQGEALILEGYKHGVGRSNWQVVGGYLEADENPMEAAKREVLEETGYVSDDWRHLSSFVMDANRRGGMGHFFLALDARPGAEPNHDDLEEFAMRWVSVDDLKLALVDGRISVISYAMTVSLGLLSLDKIAKRKSLESLFPQLFDSVI